MLQAAYKPRLQFKCRPGTQDEMCVKEVLVCNSYDLPTYFTSQDVIIDVGANIGTFTFACLCRGAGTVWAYEPDEENFKLLQENVGTWLGVRLSKSAVWRNDEPAGFLPFSGYTPTHTACGTCIPGATVDGQNQEIKVPSISLDQAIRQAGDVRLLKIDAEGAEFPALYTSKCLDQVQEIVGECHEIDYYPKIVEGFTEYTMEELGNYLADMGYNVSCEAGKSVINHLGAKQMNYLFWAKR